MNKPTAEDIRVALVARIDQLSKAGANFQAGTVLQMTAKDLGILRNRDQQLVLLTIWDDLFRQGHIGWGLDVDNPKPPFCHLTARGREVLRNFSRDPANPEGYLSFLSSRTALNPIALSYVTEGLQAYNANCFKAAAVMVGCAAESLSLDLRNEIVSRLTDLGRPVPQQLNDWRIRTVLLAIEGALDAHKSSMPRDIVEGYEAYWPAFVQQIRVTRNDAGHPSAIDPVTPDAVHSSLLILPELAVLTSRLRDWVRSDLN